MGITFLQPDFWNLCFSEGLEAQKLILSQNSVHKNAFQMGVVQIKEKSGSDIIFVYYLDLDYNGISVVKLWFFSCKNKNIYCCYVWMCTFELSMSITLSVILLLKTNSNSVSLI